MFRLETSTDRLRSGSPRAAWRALWAGSRSVQQCLTYRCWREIQRRPSLVGAQGHQREAPWGRRDDSAPTTQLRRGSGCKSFGWGGYGCESQRLHHGVVKSGAELCDFLVLAGRVDAIGEEHDEELAVWIDPDRRAGEASVAEAVWREIMAAGAAFGGHRPSERARAAR